MNYVNYHTHTTFCDGGQAPEAYVKKAIELSMSQLGFSAHAPVPFENKWSMKYDSMPAYKQEIERLQKQYFPQIQIWKSLEIDYIPGITNEFDYFNKQLQLDYVIGAVHLVKNMEGKLWFIDGPEEGYVEGLKTLFNNDARRAVEMYYNQINAMVQSQKLDFIAHIDKVKMNNKNRYFSTEEAWYIKSIEQTLNLISSKDIAIEVNTRGIYKKKCEELFPGIDILKMVYLKKLPIVVNSDAHQPEELINQFNETFVVLKDIGFKGYYVFNGKKWDYKAF